MHWYGGSIAEAVALSKQRNTIFVVFVEGENDLTVEMSATLDDAAVMKRLSDQNNFLAIKLKSGSPDYTHFAQLYQFVPVPSLFFIGRNGIPLEVVCAGVEANNLASRIDKIIEEHRKANPFTAQPSTSSQSIKDQTANLLRSEAERVETKNTNKRAVDDEKDQSETSPKTQKTEMASIENSQDYEIVCDGDVCVRKPKDKCQEAGPSSRQDAAMVYNMEVDPQKASFQPNTENADQDITQESTDKEENDKILNTGSTASLEERKKLALELIEAKRLQKAEKEKEEERQKELERRKLGKGVVGLKKWQAEQELKQIQEERKREKLENEAARQKILQQIAQDRAERRARDAAPLAAAVQPAQQPAPADTGVMRARIQFKLPDGSTHSATFGADATLADLAQYVADNWQMSVSSFTLWTAFPRRQLIELTSTVTEQKLVPSAALLVMPNRAASAVTRPSPLNNIISFLTQMLTSFILEPSRQIYAWIAARVWPAARPEPNPQPRAPSQAPETLRASPPGVRRRGNIHRLAEGRNTDDDSNTWNGNSTQQM